MTRTCGVDSVTIYAPYFGHYRMRRQVQVDVSHVRGNACARVRVRRCTVSKEDFVRAPNILPMNPRLLGTISLAEFCWFCCLLPKNDSRIPAYRQELDMSHPSRGNFTHLPFSWFPLMAA